MERGRVLIVDDEEAILRNLKQMFGGEYHVLTAPSAREATAVLRREKVHVIVSDYKMPGQDGLSFLIHTKQTQPRSVRMLMTAYADMNLVVRALNEGEIHRFVAKPFRTFEFRSILEDCLRLASIIENKPIGTIRERNILIAHDSQIALSSLRTILGSSYRVLSTSNGLDALSLISGNPVDAFVTGVGLEMMDGCTIAAYLKKEKEVSFPVIFWGRDISAPFQEHLRECGADYWIDENDPDAASKLRNFLTNHLA